MTTLNVKLLIIDPQVDFHSGSLAVPGADGDIDRIIAMIRDYPEFISDIIVSLDSHHPDHIAHAKMWKSANGEQPHIFQSISVTDVVEGIWMANDPKNQEQYESYVKALEEKGGRFMLTIWPEHCLVTTPGHKIVHKLKTALDDWEKITKKKIQQICKGMNNFTEMYSAIEAEVPINSDESTKTNQSFLTMLKQADKLLICGEALSHCVNYSTRDILASWLESNKDPASLILLENGSSPVYGCKESADKFVQDMKDAGVTVTTVEDGIPFACQTK